MNPHGETQVVNVCSRFHWSGEAMLNLYVSFWGVKSPTPTSNNYRQVATTINNSNLFLDKI